MSHKPIAAGKSSYDTIDAAVFWEAMALNKNSILMDLGCGIGNYAMAAATHIGAQGLVYAIDAWAEGIEKLKQRMASEKITNIKTAVADISKNIPVPAGTVDVCLLATVAHDLIQDQRFEGTMIGITKVLPARGRLAVVEFKKIDGPPGPPIHIRLSPQELAKAVLPYGFVQQKVTEVGPYHYLAQFGRKGS